jgi:hypothetical protein
MRITGGFSGFAGITGDRNPDLRCAAIIVPVPMIHEKIKFRPLGVPLFSGIPRDWTLFPGKKMAYHFKVSALFRTFASPKQNYCLTLSTKNI